jgi:hypothetical protein
MARGGTDEYVTHPETAHKYQSLKICFMGDSNCVQHGNSLTFCVTEIRRVTEMVNLMCYKIAHGN